MDLTVQKLYDLLLRSKLLDAEEAQKLFVRWNQETRDKAKDPVRFAAWLVANKYVTEYQATLLTRGFSDGFFLDDYRILDRLGKGRMAGVYRAEHKLGQVVAIKVLPPSKAREPTLLARFQREARLAIKLRHPNVVRGFHMGVSGDLHYLIMEFLEGITLEELLHRRGKLPVREAVRLIYQALKGLAYLHELGVVHRDLKPANLMLVPTPTDSTLSCILKILDVGLGRVFFEETDDEKTGLTREGMLLGTPDYMAPEQARDPRSTDIRADIYSLGCVLYHLITGQPPFPDTNLINQMIRHATEPPKPLSEFDPEIPDGLEQILGWMMAKEPTDRYPTPQRAAKALEVFLAAGAEPTVAVEIDPQMQKYLNWLEVEATPRSTSPSGSYSPDGERIAAPRVERKSRNKAKDSAQPAKPTAQASPLSLPTARGEPMQVELIAVPSLASSAESGVTRRELFMFILGVGSGLVAYALGNLLAGWQSRSQPPEPK